MRVEIVDADRARELRRSVLRPWEPPGAPLPGDGIDAIHFAALADETDGTHGTDETDGTHGTDGTDRAIVLSTCFVFADPWPFDEPAEATGPGWHLRQMATDPGYRGRGAGSAVVDAVIAYVNGRDGVLWCHARQVAFGFYERHGFIAWGELHDSGNPPIPHRYLYRPVS